MTREMNRRDFLKGATAITAAAVGGVLGGAAQAGESRRRNGSAGQGGLVDVNVTLSRWPFRRLPLDDTRALVTKLRSQSISQAWAGSFDGLLHKDIDSVNARLTEECRRNGHGLLLPFGSINPALPDWEEDLRRCHEEHEMTGIRLHPNYHGYRLDDPKFSKLLDLAGERSLIVQLAVMMEDERTQNALARVAHVDVAPLVSAVEGRPKARIVLLNWSRGVKGALLSKLAQTGRVFFDIATVEGVGGIANLLKQVPADRVLFGSYAPFFYFESALLKLRESVLTASELTAIRAGNARRLMAGR